MKKYHIDNKSDQISTTDWPAISYHHHYHNISSIVILAVFDIISSSRVNSNIITIITC